MKKIDRDIKRSELAAVAEGQKYPGIEDSSIVKEEDAMWSELPLDLDAMIDRVARDARMIAKPCPELPYAFATAAGPEWHPEDPPTADMAKLMDEKAVWSFVGAARKFGGSDFAGGVLSRRPGDEDEDDVESLVRNVPPIARPLETFDCELDGKLGLKVDAPFVYATTKSMLDVLSEQESSRSLDGKLLLSLFEGQEERIRAVLEEQADRYDEQTAGAPFESRWLALLRLTSASVGVPVAHGTTRAWGCLNYEGLSRANLELFLRQSFSMVLDKCVESWKTTCGKKTDPIGVQFASLNQGDALYAFFSPVY